MVLQDGKYIHPMYYTKKIQENATNELSKILNEKGGKSVAK